MRSGAHANKQKMSAQKVKQKWGKNASEKSNEK